MRFKQRVPKHIAEQVVDTRTTCDACGSDVQDPEKRDGFADKITILAKLGPVYPETDPRTVYEVDACATCFVEKVIPALEAAGFKVRERDAEEDGREWEPGLSHP